MSCSAAMRSDAILLSSAMRAVSVELAGLDLGRLDRADARDLAAAGLLLGHDAVDGDLLFLRDAGGLDRLARGDFGLVDRPRAGDVERAHALLLRDARGLGHLARRDVGLFDRARALDLELAGGELGSDALGGQCLFADDAGGFGRLGCRDLLLLDGAVADDLAPADVLLGGDALVADDALLRDTRALDALARGDFGLVDQPATLDLALTNLALRQDARLGDGALVGDARLLDLLARSKLRLLGLGVAQRALARELGALHGAAHLDVALLIEPGGLALAVDIQRLLLGFEVAGADQDHRILFDVVAQLAPGLDVLDQLGEALGVEAVGRVEEFEIGLVEIDDRHRFELEAVLLHDLQRRLLDAGDVFAAPLVHLHHGHFGGDRAQRGDELAG